MIPNHLRFLVFVMLLGACGADKSSEESTEHEAPESNYVVLQEDLQQLKDDFNANEGRVRLVFLSGPSCGICLRGMADLNDEFIADSQTDDRLVTFVVHLPTLGAKEHHAADSIPLLAGPRIHHYWEPSGIIGQHYSEVMDVPMYVWDFWAIYGPEAIWDGILPPVPDYYEHQLGVSGGPGGFPDDRVLDAERFATETRKYLDKVDGGRFAAHGELDQLEGDRLASGTVIPVVAQPRNVAVRQHIMNRGGYGNLKRIQSIEAKGRIEAGGRSFDLTIQSKRPNSLRRLIGDGEDMSVAELNQNGEALIDSEVGRALPRALEMDLLTTFEFDGLFVDWPDKGHEVSMVGMLKIDDVLAWRLDLLQKDGAHWNLFIDSHTGELLQMNILDARGETEYVIRQSDFKKQSGFSFPFRTEYLDGEGRSLAIETIDELELVVSPFVLEQDAVSH